MSRPLRAALAISALLAFGLYADVRPLSEAERAATRVVADYLARGPQAVAEQLAAASPLKKMPPADALEEIETRLGPPADSSWELQTVVPAMAERAAVFSVDYPTGVDDSIVLEMTKEGSDYRVADIRILAQKSRTPQVFPPVTKIATTATEASRLPAIATLIAGLLAAAFAAAGAAMRRKMLVVLAIVVAAGGAALAILKDSRFVRPSAAATKVAAPVTTELRLRPLLAFRRALATGSGDVEALYAAAPKSGEVGRVADLWKAQWDLQQSQPDRVKRTLVAFPSPSEFPLAEILRARLALTKSDEANSIVAYEHAVNLGPGRDGLWLETAQALMALGWEDRAAGYLQRLDRIGSRKPDAHYILSLLAAQKGKEEDAEAQLKRAWAMRPAERSQLVEAGVLWSVLRRESTVNVIGLSAPTEATFAAPDTSARAIALPAGAAAWISGEFLHVQIGGQQLSVPGGAVLAPPGTRVADAGEWQRERDERSLNELPQLLSRSGEGAFAQPASRERIVRAANALAKRNRWADLLKLTDGMSPASEHVPSTLFFLRSEALKRSDRVVDAKQLLTSVAASKVLQRQNDSQALAELGSSLAALDEYELGVKMLDKSQAMHPNPMLDEQVRQIQMNKRLATSYTTVTTPHFELHVPQEMSSTSAAMTGDILEKELARLQGWVSIPDFKRVVVNIVWWDEFRSTYTGSDFIVGFYTGKITLPFAGVEEYIPEIVAILSHELCHAMIAQRTHDQAPHWFQEGLAQRIEMKQYSMNAFNMYTDDRLLAVSLLDAVLRGSPDPGMISEAYIESQTIIRYVEAKYGRAGVTKMLDAFRDGATTEEAIQRLTGKPVAQFDTDLRAWGRTGTKVFEDNVMIHYDGEKN